MHVGGRGGEHPQVAGGFPLDGLEAGEPLLHLRGGTLAGGVCTQPEGSSISLSLSSNMLSRSDMLGLMPLPVKKLSSEGRGFPSAPSSPLQQTSSFSFLSW